MTRDEFRGFALALEGAQEAAHMGQPDFRVGGRIFATLSEPGRERGMVRLPPEQQQVFVEAHPGVFAPVNGAWGAQGCTWVELGLVDPEVAASALRAAWLHRQAKPARRRSGR